VEVGTRSPRRRLPSRGDRREQAILDGARALLEVRPLTQLTVDELASAAGISRSSFYFYFDGKPAVLGALLEGLAEEFTAESGPWLEALGPDVAALRQATANSVALWRTHGGLLRQAWRADGTEPQLAAWRDGVVDRGLTRSAAKIARDRAAGLAPPGPPSPEVLARMLYAMRSDALARRTGETDDVQLVEDLVAATLRLLYGELPARDGQTGGP
jgi:TetR/AcrR family transcriptional regulator, ethionamide resistance regulator